MRQPSGNDLLDRLIAAGGLPRTLELIALKAGEELFTPGAGIARVYFPTTCVCSILLGLNSGQRAEAGTVGSEGFVGIPVALGISPTDYAIVQVPGKAHVLAASVLKDLLEANARARGAILRYIGYAYHVAEQTTACNSYHTVGQRLARWLLICHDRAHADSFPMTQELLSHMVAATRPRVSEAAARLRSQGVLDYRHGEIHIKNRASLEAKACECYAVTAKLAR